MAVTRKMKKRKDFAILAEGHENTMTYLIIWFEGLDHTALALAGYAEWVRLDGKDNLLECMYVSDTMKEAVGDSWQWGLQATWGLASAVYSSWVWTVVRKTAVL